MKIQSRLSLGAAEQGADVFQFADHAFKFALQGLIAAGGVWRGLRCRGLFRRGGLKLTPTFAQELLYAFDGVAIGIKQAADAPERVMSSGR